MFKRWKAATVDGSFDAKAGSLDGLFDFGAPSNAPLFLNPETGEAP